MGVRMIEWKLWFVACFLGVFIAGCATSSPYKAAVKIYSGHTVEYARGVSDCKAGVDGGYTDSCMRDWAGPMSVLPCLVDEDEKKSTGSGSTTACKCARASSKDSRKEACTNWLSGRSL